jgi:hypothetical protein
MTRRHEVLTAVVEALAEASDCPAHELDYSLQDHIDTGAMLTLVTSKHTDWELTFEVPDHTVTVRGNGRIFVDDTLCRDLTTGPRPV